jgi:hypothetical protein
MADIEVLENPDQGRDDHDPAANPEHAGEQAGNQTQGNERSECQQLNVLMWP